MPKRNAPLPDFRCVHLTPAPPEARLFATRMWLLASLLTSMVAAWALLTEGLGLSSLSVFAVSLLAFRAAASSKRADGAHRGQAPMLIVPWGVVVDPDRDTRVLHWAAVLDVSVQEKHVLRGGTPRVVSSQVTVRTMRERLAGRISGPAGLEHLTANLGRYAEEAARSVAADLDGVAPAVDSDAEPVVEQLIRRARALCSTGEGAMRLRLPSGGYRQAALTTASCETATALRSILSSKGSHGADPRPLAAVIAAHLGATSLVPDLLRLMSSPHPVVAAVAKASALCLGASPNRAGTLDEVAAFIRDEDLAALRELAGESDVVSHAA